jgi:hypothetical protein
MPSLPIQINDSDDDVKPVIKWEDTKSLRLTAQPISLLSTPTKSIRVKNEAIVNLLTPPKKHSATEVIDLCTPSPPTTRNQSHTVKMELEVPELVIIDNSVRVGSVYSSLEAAKGAVYGREELRGHVWRVAQSKRDDNTRQQRKVTLRCNHYSTHNPVHSITIDPSDHREGKSVKTDCNARVNVNRRADGLWYLTTVVFEHNHPPQLADGARRQRPPSDAQKAVVRQFASDRKFERRHLERILERDFPDHLLERRQITNLINEARQEAQDHVAQLGGDMQAIISELEQRSAQELGWFFRLRLDVNQVVIGIFWQSPRQVENARRYYDILLNDSSYNRNQYQYILNIGLIVNSANQSRTIWQALHATKDIETQNWVFQCHLESTGLPPEVIATDRHQTLIASVRIVFPLTFHLYCLHHLTGNVSQQLRLTIGPDWVDFMQDFWVTYRSPSPTIFDKNFEQLITKYPKAERYLRDELYSCREHWAHAWISLKFTAGIRTQGCVEKENDVTKSLGGPKSTALQLFTGLNQRGVEQHGQDAIQTRQVRLHNRIITCC